MASITSSGASSSGCSSNRSAPYALRLRPDTAGDPSATASALHASVPASAALREDSVHAFFEPSGVLLLHARLESKWVRIAITAPPPCLDDGDDHGGDWLPVVWTAGVVDVGVQLEVAGRVGGDDLPRRCRGAHPRSRP